MIIKLEPFLKLYQKRKKMTTVQREKRFDFFCKELGKISKKYGVLIQSTGGVIILSDEDKSEIKNLFYVNDHTSGDLDYEIQYAK